MSGGSWDYVCFKIDDAAGSLCESKIPARRALGDHMKKIAHAMHEIEWVDSGDKSSPSDIDAIRAVFDDCEQRELEILLGDARNLIKELEARGA